MQASLEAGAVQAAIDLCIFSPVCLAIKWNRTEIIRLLVEKKAVDLNSLNERNQSPLEYAVRYGTPELVRLLFQLGADVNYDPHCEPPDSRDMYAPTFSTPLLTAVSLGKRPMVELLLSYGAVPLQESAGVGSPLQEAEENAEENEYADLIPLLRRAARLRRK